MEIRRTAEADLVRVMDIYAHARAFMAAHGNPDQWGPTNWPPEALIRQDIARGRGYVCVHEGRVVGAFFFDMGRDVAPTYRHLVLMKSKYKNRLAVSGRWLSRQVAGNSSRKWR